MNASLPTVGQALADLVATRLEAGNILAYSHPEYCGIGLQYAGGVYICAEVNDGEMPNEAQFQACQQRGDAMEFAAFHSRAEFVDWLAAQTDESLSGHHLASEFLHNNQRLTLARLRQFVA